MVAFAGQESSIWAVSIPWSQLALLALEGFTKQTPATHRRWCLGQEVTQQLLVTLAPSLWLSDVPVAKCLVQTAEYFGGFGVGALGLWWTFSW